VTAQNVKDNVIAGVSFDFAKNKYPKLNSITFGLAEVTKQFVKLIPGVGNSFGQFSLRKKLQTSKFSADLTFEIKQAGSGFALFYVHSENTERDNEFGALFGYAPDFSGLGVFVTPDSEGNWVVHSNINKGMNNFTIDQHKFVASNTCAILGNTLNVPRTIRVDLMGDQLTVFIKGESSGIFEK
jgi:hypothetical protein